MKEQKSVEALADADKQEQEIAEVQNKLLGLWEHREGEDVLTLEFKDGGILIATSHKTAEDAEMTYKVIDDKTLLIEEMGKVEERHFTLAEQDGKPQLTISQTDSSTVTYEKL